MYQLRRSFLDGESTVPLQLYQLPVASSDKALQSWQNQKSLHWWIQLMDNQRRYDSDQTKLVDAGSVVIDP